MAKKNDVKIKGEADAMNVEKVTKNEWIDEGFGSGRGQSRERSSRYRRIEGG